MLNSRPGRNRLHFSHQTRIKSMQQNLKESIESQNRMVYQLPFHIEQFGEPIRFEEVTETAQMLIDIQNEFDMENTKQGIQKDTLHHNLELYAEHP